MGKVAEQPRSIEDVDSQKHRKMFEVLVGTKPGTPQPAYDELCRYLSPRYGKVGWVEKEEQDGIPFKSSEPFIIMECTSEQARKLREDYELNSHRTPLRYVRCVRRMQDSVRLID